MHRFLVSAAHKSSGKTTLSIGLCAALRARGLVVQPFKKGPDYIDPMWLGRAAGRDCYNLDLYLSSADEIRRAFADRSPGADVCLVEGNKGLYDGLSLDGSNSNAALATALDLPVILVIDTRGMTRGIAPLILGYQAFDPAIRIAGVILNRVGGRRHESKLRAVIEHYTRVPVVGAVPETPDLAIVERHLGLVPSNEAGDAAERIDRLARAVAENVDLERLLALTAAPALPVPAAVTRLPRRPARTRVRIGVARDAAFGFYYPDDLAALAAAGAEIVEFDTVRDAALPAVDGLFIGGGFPESLASGLAANASLRAQIRAGIDAGLPVYAECGGLMYLTRTITWHGETYPMVGAIAADTLMHDRPVGRGYVELEATADHPWMAAAAGRPIVRCHEFHYSSLENVGADTRYAWNVRRGHGIDGARDGIVVRNTVAGFAHLRAVLGNDWPARFVAFVRAHRSARTPEGALPLPRARRRAGTAG